MQPLSAHSARGAVLTELKENRKKKEEGTLQVGLQISRAARELARARLA
jgi:hypothetical protein